MKFSLFGTAHWRPCRRRRDPDLRLLGQRARPDTYYVSDAQAERSKLKKKSKVSET